MKRKYIRNLIKKVFLIMLVSTITIDIMNISFADDEEEDDNNEIENTSEEETNLEVDENISSKPQINSRRYAVYDRKSKTTIYGNNENKQTAMASTTKIMTAIIVLENTENLNEVVEVESKAAGTGGSRLGLKTGDKITINDLLYGLLMRSGNDAAVELAIHTAGSITDFAELMNLKAKELGLKDTNFVTPHGLDDPKHYTTATELAKIADYALNNKKFSMIVDTQFTTITINGESKEIKNTNELLGKVNGVYGVKTGFTNNAGRCLVTAIKTDKLDIIIVTLGADTRKDRGTDTLKLLKYIQRNFTQQNIESCAQEEFEMWKDINENRIYVSKGQNQIRTKLAEIPIKEILTDKELEIDITTMTYFDAPISTGTRIGTATIKCGNRIIEEVSIITENSVNRKGIIEYMKIFAKYISD